LNDFINLENAIYLILSSTPSPASSYYIRYPIFLPR